MAFEQEQSVVYVGKCNFRGNERVFGIKTKVRLQHVYVIGKTGTGKTTLLENMVLQDIRAGRGVGIIDPHGEFVEQHVLPQIPLERINDVVYFNPVDADYPIGFNVLEVPDVRYKHLIVSNLLGIFTKIWAGVWSARMEYILQNCILALMDTPGTTLLGIPRLLVDREYREKIVADAKDPVVRSFWIDEYEKWRDQFRNEAIVPIQNKVNQFLNTGFIRNIVGQAKSTFNIPDLMNERKILLVNVSKGRVGEDNSALLGAMIITTVQLAAMERVRIPEEDRRDFYLYVDEFQNFATDSFASILSEARKYRLNLIIAHQYTGQLVTDVSTKVRDAVFGNVGTMIAFRVGAGDAEFLEKEFMPEFVQQDLIGLPNYEVYLKLMVEGVTSRPFSATTLPPLKFERDPAIKEKIMKASRARYGRSRIDVEAEITAWSGMGKGEGTGRATGDERKMYEAVCGSCGKQTMVPFKPDGKRPVYCLACLKRIEEEKLTAPFEQIPSVSKPAGERPRRPDRTGLKPRPPLSLGRASGLVTDSDRTSSQRFSPSEITHSKPVTRTPESVKPISLSELSEKGRSSPHDPSVDAALAPSKRSQPARELRRAREKPSVDSAGLKKVLEEALAGDKKDVPEERLEDKPIKIERIEGGHKVIEPGESVRFP